MEILTNVTLFNATATEVLFWGMSGGSLGFTLALTFWLVYSHLSYYTIPQAQALIIRIAMMAPIYGLNSLLSLLFHEYSIYFELACACYEAFVLYQFFSLLLYYFNANATSHFPDPDTDVRLKELSSLSDHDVPYAFEEEGDTIYHVERRATSDPTTTSHYLGKLPSTRCPLPLCCCHVRTDSRYLFACIRIAVFQYVMVKPTLAVTAIILHRYNLYHPGSFDPRYGYLWITLAMNLSILVAFYFLIVFYQLVHHVIKRHRPLSKLVAIKAVLFFLFWQSVAIAVLGYMKWLPLFDIRGEDRKEVSAAALTNLIISFEMIVLALANVYAFSNYEYKIAVESYTIPDPLGSTMEGEIEIEDSSVELSDEADRPLTKNKKTGKKVHHFVTSVLNPIDSLKDGRNILRGKDTKVAKND